MSAKTINLTPALHDYLLRVSLREPAILKQLREKTHELSTFNMQISPEQGQLMAFLVELIGAKKTLDVGTYTGYSALAVGLAMPADGKVIACDINEEWTSMGKSFWQQAKIEHKIELRLAPALETLDNLIADGEVDTFDFAFIDADKANYLAYYEKCLTLLRPGGLMAIDNVLWGGAVADPANQEKATRAIRDLNDFVHQDARVTISMVPISDGLTLARKT